MIEDSIILAAKVEGERRAGGQLSDFEFGEVLAHTLRKMQLNGHPDDYLPLLLADEVKDAIFRNAVNHVSHECMAICREFDAKKKGESKCLPQLPQLPAQFSTPRRWRSFIPSSACSSSC